MSEADLSKQEEGVSPGLGPVWRWMPWWVALLAALLTFLTIRRGIYLYHDSWAYWESSVSLLSGRGFNYLDGDPIMYWPIGFPMLLAAVQRVLGTSAGSLIVFQVLLAGISGFAWGGYVRLLAAGRCAAPRFIHGGVIGIWVGMFVSMSCHGLLANSVVVALAGGIFWTLTSTFRQGPIPRLRQFFFLATMLSASALIHSSGMALIAGVAGALFLVRSGSVIRRAIWPGALIAVAMIPWFALRLFLDQKNSHPIVPRPSLGRIWHYFTETVFGLGEFVVEPARMSPFGYLTTPTSIPLGTDRGLWEYVAGSAVILIGIYSGLRLFLPRRKIEALGGLLVVLLSSGAICSMFIFVGIHDRPAGRFLWQVPLALFPIVLLVVPRDRVTFLALACVLFAATGITVAKTWSGRGLPPRDPDASVFPHWAGYPEFYLTCQPANSAPGGKFAVLPPSFAWNWTRWPKDRRPEAERGKVWILREGKIEDWWR